jgi:alkanesulfonate monooxygenase SsuD/methylene tetrahydromethanopterin reductase-like flavin-dependent oxidoreductase (luciferase family)
MGRLSPADFHTVYGFRRPDVNAFGELTPGLRFGLSLHPTPEIRSLGAARLVSTPSRLVSHRAWLGIAVEGFPEFEQFYIAGFPGEHSSFP